MSNLTETIYDWPRFWIPINSQFTYEPSHRSVPGFLLDPESMFNPNKDMVQTEDLMKKTMGCIILLGDPGMGKSQALKTALSQSSEFQQLPIDFRNIPDIRHFERLTVDSKIWDEWINEDGALRLVIDGVDEGLIKISGFVGYLATLLDSFPLDRLQIILACRSIEWPQSEGQRLMSLWNAEVDSSPQAGAFELLPLRSSDAKLAATEYLSSISSSSSGDDFIEIIYQRHLSSLASRPITLKMLLHEYGEGTIESSTHGELYRRFLRFLCSEPDRDRKSRLRHLGVPNQKINDGEKYQVAGRIACMLSLCGRSAVWPGNSINSTENDLKISEICGGVEVVYGEEIRVTEDVVLSVLECPLFWPKGEGRIGFFHQTFLECLAAEYLSNLPIQQIRSLLFGTNETGQFVYPHLAEVAAWIASGSADLFDLILKKDPAVLVRSDVTKIPIEKKERLISEILSRAAKDELFDSDGFELFYHTFSHPNLAKQIRECILDNKLTFETRRMALHIAEKCQLVELIEDLILLASDPNDEFQRQAASAFITLVTPESATKLAKLVKEGCNDCSSHVIYYAIIGLLHCEHWSLSDSFPYLEKAFEERSDSYIIAQYAKQSDVVALLEFCIDLPDAFNREGKYRYLVKKAGTLGLKNNKNSEVLQLIAKLWINARIDERSNYPEEKDDESPSLEMLLERDLEFRRSFQVTVVSLLPNHESSRIYSLYELVQKEDLKFLIEKTLEETGQEKPFFAELASASYDRNDHSNFCIELQAAVEVCDEISAAFSWLRVWALNDPKSIEEKEAYYDKLKWQKRAEENRVKDQPDPVKVWKENLEEIETRRPEDWLNLAHNLYYNGGLEKEDDTLRHDIKTSPGWKYFAVESRNKIIAGARRFLLEVKGNPKHQLGNTSPFDDNAYKAMVLLRNDILEDDHLRHSVRDFWIPTILDYWSYSDDTFFSLIALAYELNPPIVHQWVEAVIEKGASQEQGYCNDLKNLSHIWDDTLLEVVCSVVISKVENQNAVGNIIDLVCEDHPHDGFKIWMALKTDSSSGAEGKRRSGTVAVITNCLFLFWDELWPEISQDESFAIHYFKHLDHYRDGKLFRHLEENREFRLAELFLLMLKLYPRSEDPPTPNRVFTPSQRMNIGRIRDGILQILASFGSLLSVQELWRISQTVSGEDAHWVKRHWFNASTAYRRSEWIAIKPTDFTTLVGSSNRRWLRNEDDLLHLVLESLFRLNENLTSKPNSQCRDYWKITPKTKTTPKYCKPDGEVEMARRITTWLQMDLDSRKGITVQREVQAQWNERTDIEVRSVGVVGSDLRPLEIVIEVKGCWHKEVLTAHKSQLVEKYLSGSGRTHGLYLIVWTQCSSWNDPSDTRKTKLRSKTIDEARDEVEMLVEGYDGKTEPYFAKSFVLDAALKSDA